MLEIEYRGLNVFDEISVVEIAINPRLHTIHIFDKNQVVEPYYNYSTSKYCLDEGFYNMTKVLYDKQFIGKKDYFHSDNWFESYIFIFYGSKKSILKYEKGEIYEVIKSKELDFERIGESELYWKYAKRLK